MKVTENLFGEYKNNIPIFRSVLDSNFEGAVFVDDENTPSWAVLQTPICFHFLAGSHMESSMLDNILFNCILTEQAEKQLIVFSPSDDWQPILKSVFLPRKGFIVPRKMFSFNYEDYRNAGDWQNKMPKNAEMVVIKERCDPFCTNDEWTAKLMISGVCVSTCSAPMVGGGYAEISVESKPDFQGKGYATLTSLALIEKLLQLSLIPCWSAWPYRGASQSLALKIGFLPQPDVNAWLWDESDCK